jgi:hypothetical protein
MARAPATMARAEVVKHHSAIQDAFIRRTTHAIERLATQADEATLVEAMAAPTDFGTLARVLTDVGAIGSAVAQIDPDAIDLAHETRCESLAIGFTALCEPDPITRRKPMGFGGIIRRQAWGGDRARRARRLMGRVQAGLARHSPGRLRHDRRQYHPDIASTAAPIFSRQEKVLGSLMLAISLHDPAFDGFAALAPRVMEAAREISRRIALMDDAAALPARAVG